MGIRPGLVSITFRQLKPEEVVAAAASAGLSAIEWGGDIHVPHGDLAAAERVAALTAEAGLAVAAYGSYYRLAHSAAEGLSAETVVRTAEALGAPTVRVWAGRTASADADDAHWSAVVDDARRIGELAAAAGMTVSFEYHRGTLTDTRASTARLLAALPEASIRTLWQPQPERSRAENVADLAAVLPRLSNVHVFTWTPTGERLPLADGQEDWVAYLSAAAAAPGDRYALIEFVVDDDPARLGVDAAALIAALPH
jgi:sugar phosphate isomerase/epimerase